MNRCASRLSLIVAIACAVGLWAGRADAATRFVRPGITIQSAIDMSSSGDTIIVLDGTYTGPGNRDLNFHGKAINLRSQKGPDRCIIKVNRDCPTCSARGFIFTEGETQDTIVDGFTITGAYTYNSSGAAFHMTYSSPTIRNNVIYLNTASGATGTGGAMYIQGGSPIITDNYFGNNTATGSFGGGAIDCWDTGAAIIRNEFWGNVTDYDGGAIYTIHGSPVIANNWMWENWGDRGGAICTWASQSTIINNVITRNLSRTSAGGGIYARGYPATCIQFCTILENDTTSVGRAIAFYDTTAVVWDCLIPRWDLQYAIWVWRPNPSWGCLYMAPVPSPDTVWDVVALQNSNIQVLHCVLSETMMGVAVGGIAADPPPLGADLPTTGSTITAHYLNAYPYFDPLYYARHREDDEPRNIVIDPGPPPIVIDREDLFADPAELIPMGDLCDPNDDFWELGRDWHTVSSFGRFNPYGVDDPTTPVDERWVYDYDPVNADVPVQSLAIDAATPGSRYEREPYPNGAAGNLGAYGNTPEASKSAPGYSYEHYAWDATGLTFTNLAPKLIIEGPAAAVPAYRAGNKNIFAINIYGENLGSMGAVQTELNFFWDRYVNSNAYSYDEHIFRISTRPYDPLETPPPDPPTYANPGFGGQAIWQNSVVFASGAGNLVGLYDGNRQLAGFISIAMPLPDQDITARTLLMTITYDYTAAANGKTFRIDSEMQKTWAANMLGDITLDVVSGSVTIEPVLDPIHCGDVNNDGIVNILDLIFIRGRLNLDVNSGDNWRADVNLDGRINIMDMIHLRTRMGNTCP